MLHHVRGLPTHVLLVHGVVVLVPLAALALAVAAWWPAARDRLGVGLPVFAAGTLALVPLATNSGQWLRQQLGPLPLVERHAALGRQLLPWTAGVLLLSVVVWLRGRRETREPSGDARAGRAAGSVRSRERAVSGAASPSLLATALVGVLATAVAVGTVIQVVRVGESGSRAVWHGVVSTDR